MTDLDERIWNSVLLLCDLRETEGRVIAELIVTKHRNGLIGTVKLLFEPQYTRYRNLAA